MSEVILTIQCIATQLSAELITAGDISVSNQRNIRPTAGLVVITDRDMEHHGWIQYAGSVQVKSICYGNNLNLYCWQRDSVFTLPVVDFIKNRLQLFPLQYRLPVQVIVPSWDSMRTTQSTIQLVPMIQYYGPLAETGHELPAYGIQLKV